MTELSEVKEYVVEVNPKKPTEGIPTIRFSVVLEMQEKDGIFHPMFCFIVIDDESLKTLHDFYPVFKQTRSAFKAKRNRIPDEAFYLFNHTVMLENDIYLKKVGTDEKSGESYSNFGRVKDDPLRKIHLNENYFDFEEGSFQYALSVFLRNCLLGQLQPSLLDLVKQGKIEIVLKPGFLEHVHEKLKDAWLITYRTLDDIFAPDFTHLHNALTKTDLYNVIKDEGILVSGFYDRKNETPKNGEILVAGVINPDDSEDSNNPPFNILLSKRAEGDKEFVTVEV